MKNFYAFAGQRLISVFCALTIFAGLAVFMPIKNAAGAVPEAAEIWEGDGNSASPYLVEAAFQLDSVRYFPAAFYKMTADINLSEYTDFSPIADKAEPFTGSFDGAGFSVYNFEISSSESAGLFAYIKNATVKNLTVRDSFISGTKFAGAIAGKAENSSVINCRNINTAVTGGDGAAAGGIAGELSGRMEYVSNAGSVCAGEDSAAGGIAGRINNAVLEYCYNTAGVSAVSGIAGGLAAEAGGTAFSCYNSGPVSAGKGVAGGIFGTADSTASACYNSGRISSLTTAAGGLFGIARVGAQLRYSYNAGAITQNPSNLYGAVAGINEGAAFTAVYCLNSADYQIGGGLTATNITRLTPKNMYSEDALPEYMSGINPYPANTYFTKPDRETEGCGTAYFPELSMFANGQHAHDFVQGEIKNYDNLNSKRASLYSVCGAAENETHFTAGHGTPAQPYEIENAAGLSHIRAHPGDFFILTKNINLSGFTYTNDTADIFGWKPIGTKDAAFTGNFDGGGHVISGLTISRPNEEFAGLFGYIKNGAVKNLGISGCKIIAGSGSAAGALTGAAENSEITGCFATSEIICDESRAAGGLAGELKSGKIEKSFTKSKIFGEAQQAGGITGINRGSIFLTYSIPGGVLPECGAFGGITGLNNGQISRVYSTFVNTGNTAKITSFGAVAGENTGEITNSYCLRGTSGTGNGPDDVTPVEISDFTAPGGLPPAISGLNSNPTSPDFTNTGDGGVGCRIELLPVLVCFGEASWIFEKISRDCAVYSSCEAGEYEAFFEKGSGTTADPYQISSPEHLSHINQHLNADFILTADLDLKEYSFSSLGNESSPFNGIFDGNGHRISGITAPLFGVIGGEGYLSRLRLDEAEIYSDNEYTGAAAGINNGQIFNCIINGSLSGSMNTGGIAGKNAGTISGCIFDGSVETNRARAGGIAALNSGNILTCFVAGTVSGGENTAAGGIAGENSGEIKYCLNTARIVNSSLSKGAIAGIPGGVISYTYYSSECGAAGNGTALTAGELTDSAVLASLAEFAANGWQKRATETETVFYPEITGIKSINAEFAAVLKFAVSVNKRELTQVTPVPSEITYGQSLSEALIDGTGLYSDIAVPGSFTWNTENQAEIIPENGGKYDVLFTPSQELYKPAIVRNIAVTVNPAEPDLPTPGIIVYDPEQTLADIPLEQGWKWDEPEIVPQVNNSGYSASYTPANANYKSKNSVLLSVTVQPAAAKKPVLEARVYDPDKTLAEIILPEGWQWDKPETVPDTYKNEYPASYTDPGGNYREESGVLLRLIITSAHPGLPQVAAVTYREGLMLSNIALPPGWSWNAPETYITVNNSGFPASFDAGDNWNFINIAAEIIHLNIIPAIPETPEIEPIIYQSGKKLKDIILPDGWSFRDAEVCPTVKNNGYILIYTPDDKANYAYTEITLSLKVEPAVFTGTVPAVRGVDFYSGITLRDVALLENWRWENPDLPLSAGNRAYKAIYEDPDGNYLPITMDVYVKVGDFTIKYLKSKYTMRPGDLIELAPEPGGGEWEYDEGLLSAEIKESAIFTALKPGSTEITYTVGGKEFKSNVVILSGIDNEGKSPGNDKNDNSSPNPGTGRSGFSALMMMGLCAVAVILLRKKTPSVEGCPNERDGQLR